ncbi:MAG TPA: lysylphosphatidylglycerol synthase transmembrane domain-containing protein [Dehalococcoidia bacterium]|nr:lysylphosphatidylglycerol synthase transmembrane domain-containing protein [Dehalococcoidia bacterium]
MSRLLEPRFLIRTAVSLALLGFLVWRIDLEDAGRALRDANYVYVVPALALFGLAKLLVAQRWRLMMANFKAVPPLNALFGILLVSNLANNVVPVRLGDILRVQMPAQRYGTSRARLAATVFATESLLDGVAFAILGLIGLALIDLNGFPTSVFWGMLGGVSGGLVAVVPLSHLRLNEGWTCRGVLARLPERAQSFLETAVPHFIDGLAVFKTLRLALPALSLSMAIWILEAGMFALFGRAFGISLSFPAWLLIMVVANMISAVPVAPSNIGAYEVAVAETLKALGIGVGAAGGFAIASHIFNILWITVAGFAAMWALGLGLTDVFTLHAREPEVVRVEPGREPATVRR